MSALTYNGGSGPDDFYLPLLSDSSGNVFPDNKLSHFRVQLETPLYLEGEWECGLAEVMWPPSDQHARQRRSLQYQGIASPHGEEAVSTAVAVDEEARSGDSTENERIAATSVDASPAHGSLIPEQPMEEGGKEEEEEEDRQRNRPHSAREGMQEGPWSEAGEAQVSFFSSIEPMVRAEETHGEPDRFTITTTEVEDEEDWIKEGEEPSVREVALHPPPVPRPKSLYGPPGLPWSPSLTGVTGVTEGSRVFVYCDIIRPVLCSDFKGKCLRIMPMNRGVMHQSLYPVYYYALEKKVIDTIHVEIMDKYGHYLNFAPSKNPLVLVLHFKRSAVVR